MFIGAQSNDTRGLILDTKVQWVPVYCIPSGPGKIIPLSRTYIPAMPIVGPVFIYIKCMNVRMYVHMYNINIYSKLNSMFHKGILRGSEPCY